MSQQPRPIRCSAAALPAAIAGSLALSLGGAPAHAAEAPAGPRPATVVPDARPVAMHTVRSAARQTTYRVVRGDTVSAIAGRFGLRTADVLTWNRLGWSTMIYPGQTLRLTPHNPAAPKAPAVTAVPAGPAAAPGSGYVVRAGDTVSAIARRHGVSTQAVLNANRLRWSSIIVPGQKLTIPGTAAPALRDAAPAAARRVAEPASVPGTVAIRTVRAGDTMSAIAGRYGVTVTALLHANGMDWNSIIYPGQQVRIPASGIPGLTTEQAANARMIVRIGRQLGVPARGIAIALGTAMQESGLRNLDHGDRDSLGLFQQRPSYGWGTPAQVRDAERATRVFYGGPHNPNAPRTRGLLDVSGWQKLTFAGAAQAVQNSAYPDLYAQWEKPAAAWLAAIG